MQLLQSQGREKATSSMEGGVLLASSYLTLLLLRPFLHPHPELVRPILIAEEQKGDTLNCCMP